MQLSVEVRNGMLDSIETTIGPNPTMLIFSGADMPINTATADAGQVCATLALAADWMTAAAAGQKSKSGTWEDPSADLSGKSRYFRIKDAGAVCHWQGLCSMPWQPSTAVELDEQVHNGGNVYRCTTAGQTAASGGPTGTGSGVVDGAAVWTYVGKQDMTLDNVDLQAGQVFTINSLALTAPNA